MQVFKRNMRICQHCACVHGTPSTPSDQTFITIDGRQEKDSYMYAWRAS